MAVNELNKLSMYSHVQYPNHLILFDLYIGVNIIAWLPQLTETKQENNAQQQ